MNQATDKAVINWQSFDINKGETTRFQQPSSTSVTLNRVTGSEQRASQIAGTLSANGRVIIVNPNGIHFSKDAQVDVSGLIATTADIDDAKFNAGNYTFDKAGNADASIQNDGNITINNTGMAALVAPQVRNNGTITAKLGRVKLSGADTYALDFYGDGLISYAVRPGAVKTLVENNGAVISDDGTITMTAAGAEGLLVNSGILKAGGGKINIQGNTVKQLGQAMADGAAKAGVVILKGNTVYQQGTVSASSTGGKGGTVIATGEKVLLSGSTKAEGKTGGGKVFVGGDYLGGNTAKKFADAPIETAKKVVVTKDATISVNATDTGDGGTAIVWSDEYTNFAGNITAHGGLGGGHGGFIETSSYNNLQATGLALANARAAGYKSGTWLLDPNNINILSGSGSASNLNESPVGLFTATNDSASIYAETIQTALNLGTSVTIQTSTAGANTQSGDITIAAGTTILKSTGGDATLTLKAHNSILFNGTAGNLIDISSTSSKLNVILNSDSEANGTGAVALTYATINTNNGDFIVGGGADPLTGFSNGGTITNVSGVDFTNSSVSTGNGNISVRGIGSTTGNDKQGIRATASSLLSTGGAINLYGTGSNNTNWNNH
ncbi:MAG: filamentous hemagglutinin N-terminal domain-containing protein [Holosporales bacterium]